MGDSTSDLSGTTTIVVGASRGLGRGIATAFAEAGAPVVAVSRTAAAFPEPAAAPAPSSRRSPMPVTLRWQAACSTAMSRRPSFWSRAQARTCVRCSSRRGRRSRSTGRPMSGSRSTGCARPLLKPLRPGSRVVVISSGAALATGRRSAAGTPAPRPPSASSRRTPRTRQSAPVWTSPSPRCCPR